MIGSEVSADQPVRSMIRKLPINPKDLSFWEERLEPAKKVNVVVELRKQILEHFFSKNNAILFPAFLKK
jgi:hypothetical protein